MYNLPCNYYYYYDRFTFLRSEKGIIIYYTAAIQLILANDLFIKNRMRCILKCIKHICIGTYNNNDWLAWRNSLLWRFFFSLRRVFWSKSKIWKILIISFEVLVVYRPPRSYCQNVFNVFERPRRQEQWPIKEDGIRWVMIESEILGTNIIYLI